MEQGGILIGRGNLEMMHAGKMPGLHDWSYAARGKEVPEAKRGSQKALPPAPSEGAWPC